MAQPYIPSTAIGAYVSQINGKFQNISGTSLGVNNLSANTMEVNTFNAIDALEQNGQPVILQGGQSLGEAMYIGPTDGNSLFLKGGGTNSVVIESNYLGVNNKLQVTGTGLLELNTSGGGSTTLQSSSTTDTNFIFPPNAPSYQGSSMVSTPTGGTEYRNISVPSATFQPSGTANSQLNVFTDFAELCSYLYTTNPRGECEILFDGTVDYRLATTASSIYLPPVVTFKCSNLLNELTVTGNVPITFPNGMTSVTFDNILLTNDGSATQSFMTFTNAQSEVPGELIFQNGSTSFPVGGSPLYNVQFPLNVYVRDNSSITDGGGVNFTNSTGGSAVNFYVLDMGILNSSTLFDGPSTIGVVGVYPSPNSTIAVSQLSTVQINYPTINISNLTFDGSTSGTVSLVAPATTTSYNLTLPSTQGADNTILTNDGSGNLSWGPNSSSGAILQGGQALGGDMVIGTTDNYGINFEADGTVGMAIDPEGVIILNKFAINNSYYGVSLVEPVTDITYNIQPPSGGSGSTIILPKANNGTANAVLTSDTTGQLSYGSQLTVGSGGVNLNSSLLYQNGNVVLDTITGTSNTFVGNSAGNQSTTSIENTALGYQALINVTSGDGNTAIGERSLYSNTSGYNTALGFQSGYFLTLGYHNICIGQSAGLNLVDSNNNLVIGDNALSNNAGSGTTNLLENTAIGNNNLGACVSGNQNTCIGYSAGPAITTGDSNTIIGANTLTKVTTGGYNTVIGSNSMVNNTTSAEYNTCIGFETNINADAYTAPAGPNYNICIGASAINPTILPPGATYVPTSENGGVLCLGSSSQPLIYATAGTESLAGYLVVALNGNSFANIYGIPLYNLAT